VTGEEEELATGKAGARKKKKKEKIEKEKKNKRTCSGGGGIGNFERARQVPERLKSGRGKVH